MNINPGQEEQWFNMRRRLGHTWLTWGLIPLGLIFVLMLVVSALEASPDVHSQSQQQELDTDRRAKAVLAISALLFFVGFSLDGRSTDAERLGRRIHQAAGGGQFRPSRAQLAAQADIAFAAINRTAIILTVIGLIIGLLAVLAIAAHLPLVSGLHLLALAGIYQVFLFSRHPYYSEVTEAAIRGELAEIEDHND